MSYRFETAVAGLCAAVALHIFTGTAFAQEVGPPFDKKKIGDLEVRANRDVKANTDKFYVLQATDKREIRDYVTKAIKVEKAWPVDIAGYLQSMVNLEKGFVSYVTPPGNPGEDPKHPGWVVVTVPDFMMPGIEEVIKSLDYSGFEFNLGDYSYAIKTKNRRPSEIANLLKNGAILSAQATVLPDDLTNTIYVADGGAAMEDASDMIKAFDAPVPQVLINAEIVEIEEGEAQKLGLDWEAWKNALPANVDGTLSKTDGAKSGSLAFAGGSPQALAQFVEFLTNTGKARVVSRPRIVATNGRSAEVSSVDIIPFTTIAQPSLDKTLNTPAGRERVDAQQEVGLRMTVTPLIGVETVDLTIDVEVSSLVGFARDDRPIISRRRTTSEPVLRDGETFVLSGLSREWTAKDLKGVPLLKHVPVIGLLFGKEIESKHTSQVVILLTPKALRPGVNPPKGEDSNRIERAKKKR